MLDKIAERCNIWGHIFYNVHEKIWGCWWALRDDRGTLCNYQSIEEAIRAIEINKKWRAHKTHVVKEL